MRTLVHSIFLVGIASLSWGRGLSDLAVFSTSMRELERTYSEPKQRVQYKKALEAYDTGNGPVTRDFEKIFKELRDLWVRIDGVGQKLVIAQKPLAFEYAAQKETYRFERVSQPLHAVWLLQNLREVNTDYCTERDNLLVDRWTPLLKNTHVFAIEKNGKYLGTTITLVPTRTGVKTILLVVPSGNDSALPESILEAFIRDYRKKSGSQLPFALLTKVTLLKPKFQKPKAGAEPTDRFEVHRLDEDGKKTGTLGPVSGFTLEDPLAKKLVTVAPIPCGPYQTRFAKGGKGNGVANLGGNTAAPNPDKKDLTIVVNSNASANSQANANSELQMPKGISNAGGYESDPNSLKALPAGRTRELAQEKPSVVNNTTNNFYGGDNKGTGTVNGSTPPSNDTTPQPTKGSGYSYLPPGFGTPSFSKGGSGHSSSPGSNAGSGQGLAGLGGGNGNNSGKAIDPGRLSPMERGALRAAEQAERALANGQRIPRDVLEDLFRGRDRVQDPAVKELVDNTSIKAYLKNPNPEDALNILKNMKSDLSGFATQVEKNLCEHCKDCPFCIDQEKRKLKSWLAPFFPFVLPAFAKTGEHAPLRGRIDIEDKAREEVSLRQSNAPYDESQLVSCGEPPPACGKLRFKLALTVSNDDKGRDSNFIPVRKKNRGVKCNMLVIYTDVENGKEVKHISQVVPSVDLDSYSTFTVFPGAALKFNPGFNYIPVWNEVATSESTRERNLVYFPGPCPTLKPGYQPTLALLNGPEAIGAFGSIPFPKTCDNTTETNLSSSSPSVAEPSTSPNLPVDEGFVPVDINL